MAVHLIMSVGLCLCTVFSFSPQLFLDLNNDSSDMECVSQFLSKQNNSRGSLSNDPGIYFCFLE